MRMHKFTSWHQPTILQSGLSKVYMYHSLVGFCTQCIQMYGYHMWISLLVVYQRNTPAYTDMTLYSTCIPNACTIQHITLTLRVYALAVGPVFMPNNMCTSKNINVCTF